jgi:hypothetical protein
MEQMILKIALLSLKRGSKAVLVVEEGRVFFLFSIKSLLYIIQDITGR